MKSKLLYLMLIMVIALILPGLAFSQPLPPGGGEVVDTPIDGGLSLLVAAGIGYGVKKVRDARKNKKD